MIRLLSLCLTLTAVLALSSRTTAASGPLLVTAPFHQMAPSAGYWHTNGTRIVDGQGRIVRIASVTWYGMESAYWVPAGLDYQPYTEIMDLVRQLGYNAIRLPYSDELVLRNPVVTQRVDANPQFRGMHALDVMDAIVNYAQQVGLKIILDDHRSQAAAPQHINDLNEALWYTARYPESGWIRDLRTLARRYRDNSAVIGMDLRNEPHTNGPGPWNLHAYLTQGATWGPYKGIEHPATDWRLAAERAGNAVLATNPHLLIFVEGVQLYPDPSKKSGVDAYWWGSILSPVARYPVVLKVPHQLVYSAHDWGPRKNPEPWFIHMMYQSLHQVWYKNWSFLVENKKASYKAPLWIGEFGTCTTSNSCAEPTSPQGQWFHFLLQYLHNHPEVGWSFFALNGRNSKDHVADNGLLNPAWDGVANQALQNDLAGIQP